MLVVLVVVAVTGFVLNKSFASPKPPQDPDFRFMIHYEATPGISYVDCKLSNQAVAEAGIGTSQAIKFETFQLATDTPAPCVQGLTVTATNNHGGSTTKNIFIYVEKVPN